MSTGLVNIQKAEYRVVGAKVYGSDYVFTALAHPETDLTLNLYDLKGKFIASIDMLKYNLASDIYSLAVTVDDDKITGFSYDFTCDGETFNDPYMTDHTVCRKYKELATDENIERAVIKKDYYDFESDKQLKLPYEDIIAYQLHVRGFTKHPSSKVKAKGTYRGIIEKIDYFKSLKINQIILMPTYEFYEFDSDVRFKDKLNYWGFKEGSYFCPKAGYSYSKDFTEEFKDMVKALHKAGIEVVMQFYFPKTVNVWLMNEILTFWYTVYHIDGFYIMGELLPKKMFFSNPFLLDAKLYISNINKEEDFFKTWNKCRFICDSNNGFLADSRRFLKGDDDSLPQFISSHSKNDDEIHRLNYITCYEGLTLNDLVSYAQKHNEENGEDNQDGTSWNFSWNCGVEGKSNKKAIKDLRLTQMKNAMCLLLLSKATPMLFMGDELMNTQNGNNNPYCHDSSLTWFNWTENKYNTELLNFVKMLTKFRRDNPILHKKASLVALGSDAGAGFPDISYHQDNAWQYSMDSYLHHIGIMESDGKDTIYIAYNMHWENHLFGLPKLRKGYVWKYAFDTSGQDMNGFKKSLKKNQDNICLYKRSVMVLKACKEGK